MYNSGKTEVRFASNKIIFFKIEFETTNGLYIAIYLNFSAIVSIGKIVLEKNINIAAIPIDAKVDVSSDLKA